MADPSAAKLELLFAHLSINNVQHVKPLVLDAIDEYQTIRSNLTYEERKKVNFIKSLLGHVERGEWEEARANLQNAQNAYQEYLENFARGIKKEPGGSDSYAFIHGKSSKITDKMAQPEPEMPTSTFDKSHYMFRDSDFSKVNTLEQDSNRLQSQHSNATSRRINLWSARHRSHAPEKENTPSVFGEDQGPTDSFKNMKESYAVNGAHSDEYPGSYSQYQNLQPTTLKQALKLTEKRDRSEGKVDDEADVNRPSKIADSYTRLYECEWHIAMDSLKRLAVIEETAIECLLYILMEAYRLCLDEAKLQVLEFENAALNIITNGKFTYTERNQLSKTRNVKHMIQYRKEVADLGIKRIQDQFLVKTLPVIHRRYGIKSENALDAYSKECIAVTWRMAIQDPPIYIDSRVKDEVIHPNRYKVYRNSGEKIRYLVWPVLWLYKGGLVLARGVAQGEGQ
ncbi:uncharacterized protein LOC128228599 [Mya arenaria]|uniref:uncharacterized protein LOC128228599 n=1 Tax=Mya arenaria TaxID=6604 RepID=UPI0022E62AD0|nr:uncharacterized protein LOC128228599 [Mya arenaria]